MVGVNSISVVYRVRRPLSSLNGFPLLNFPAAVGRKVVIKLPYKSKFEHKNFTNFQKPSAYRDFFDQLRTVADDIALGLIRIV